jgi:vacuolar-type H+-ATPase subunit C/Vma6
MGERATALVRQLLEKRLLRAKQWWFDGKRCRSTSLLAANTCAFEVTGCKTIRRASHQDEEMKSIWIELGGLTELMELMRLTARVDSRLPTSSID